MKFGDLQYLLLFCVLLLTLSVTAEDEYNNEVDDEIAEDTKEFKLEDVCGIAGGSKIVSGIDTTPGEFPWMAGIFFKYRGISKIFCGGSLIDKRHILTAAHCVNQAFHNPRPKDLVVRLNEFDLDREDEGLETMQIDVEKITAHPGWTEKEFKDDLAILRLNRDVKFSPTVLPVCLPTNSDSFLAKPAVVTGWGLTKEGGKGSATLKKASVTVNSNEDCSNRYKKVVDFPIRATNLCASDSPKDACQNDSGGPLQVKGTNDRWTQVGIVSWGIGCGDPKYPGVYARVSSYVEWIKRVIEENNKAV